MDKFIFLASELFPEGYKMPIGEALIFAVVAMLAVILILCILIGGVKILALMKFKVEEPAKPAVAAPAAKALKAEDLTQDEMVAALVATIDHKEETGKDARLVSIKKI